MNIFGNSNRRGSNNNETSVTESAGSQETSVNEEPASTSMGGANGESEVYGTQYTGTSFQGQPGYYPQQNGGYSVPGPAGNESIVSYSSNGSNGSYGDGTIVGPNGFNPNPKPTEPNDTKPGETVLSSWDDIEESVRPVTGWLVCKDGPAKGKDYRLDTGISYIGRGADCQIDLKEDQKVHRAKDAEIRYYEETGEFIIMPGEGKVLLRKAQRKLKALIVATELEPYDVIKIGDTELVFVPLVSDQFSWLGAKEEDDE